MKLCTKSFIYCGKKFSCTVEVMVVQIVKWKVTAVHHMESLNLKKIYYRDKLEQSIFLINQ